MVGIKIYIIIQRNQAHAGIEQTGRNSFVPASASASTMPVIEVTATPVSNHLFVSPTVVAIAATEVIS